MLTDPCTLRWCRRSHMASGSHNCEHPVEVGMGCDRINGDNLVVYTSVVDDYDVLVNQPFDINYVCFTDDPGTVPDGWEARELPGKELSPKLVSGRAKTHPHVYLDDYEYSLWIDGNVIVKADPVELANRYLDDVNLAVPAHPFRNCLYDEAEWCVEGGHADPDVTEEQMKAYRDAGFPEEFGLSETRVLLRKHHADDIVTLDETWWREYQKGPQRDQLNFEYAAWKTGLEYDQMPSEITYDGDLFIHYPHGADVVGRPLYEWLLRQRWNPTSQAGSLAAAAFFPPFVALQDLKAALRILRLRGPRTVFHQMRQNYFRSPANGTETAASEYRQVE